MKAALRDPANWALLVEYEGQTMVGFGGLLLIAAVFAWAFAEASYRFNFRSWFGVARSEAGADLRRSAHRLNLVLGALAWLALLIAVFGAFAWAAVVMAGALWIGGGYLVCRFGDRIPLLGARLLPATAAWRASREGKA